MNQLTQKLKTGKIDITEVPVPAMGNGAVLVKNIYSCVSVGTESSTVKTARKGYLGKAKERPAQLKQVIDKFKTQGPIDTYRAVMKKLDAHSSLGYSCVGRIIAVAEDVNDLATGDYVACGGGSACHAEVVSVPKNLCVKIPPSTDLKQAAYNSLGSIALQGIRQADTRIGEMCVVIGLGVIGQLTCSILKSAGIKVVGIDLDSAMVRMAGKHCADMALLANDSVVEQRIIDFTDGMGCDAVIITAASDSLAPINFAGAVAKKRGTVVIVGAVPTGFDREPHFYKKELSVKMSCSYGPGRYDRGYEEKGHDYPYPYVRWTERRNMQAFQEMIASNKLDLSYLTTHVFKLDEAYKIYDMVLDKEEVFAGILIEYDLEKDVMQRKVEINSSRHKVGKTKPTVSIGFLGAGSYAQEALLPNIRAGNDVVLKGVVTRSSTGSRSVADRFGFEFCSSNADDILGNDAINTVFIATRHDSHGRYVIEALQAGKNVFVEKPLCIKFEELQEIRKIYENKIVSGNPPILMVGFNRRFSLLSELLKTNLSAGPMAMIYRINAGTISPESWIQDKEIGGGRILGEVCHFIDYLTFISESVPVSVYASTMKEPSNLDDTLSIILHYQNGSIGSIHYFANGSRSVKKEYVEIFQSGTTALLNDFREVSIFSSRRPKKRKLVLQDKGQKKQLHLFVEAVKLGKSSPIPFEHIYKTTFVSYKIIKSIQTGNSAFL